MKYWQKAKFAQSENFQIVAQIDEINIQGEIHCISIKLVYSFDSVYSNASWQSACNLLATSFIAVAAKYSG